MLPNPFNHAFLPFLGFAGMAAIRIPTAGLPLACLSFLIGAFLGGVLFGIQFMLASVK